MFISVAIAAALLQTQRRDVVSTEQVGAKTKNSLYILQLYKMSSREIPLIVCFIFAAFRPKQRQLTREHCCCSSS